MDYADPSPTPAPERPPTPPQPPVNEPFPESGIFNPFVVGFKTLNTILLYLEHNTI
jgi:hypothetical protein